MDNLYRQRSQPAPSKKGFRDKVAGGLGSILRGMFGTVSVNKPAEQLSSPQQVIGDTTREGGFYHLHETQLITPGTMNWALDPFQETPIQPIWGNAFLRRPNTFSPRQRPQVIVNQGVPVRGIGGVIAGQIEHEPLQYPPVEQGS